jgi:FixJ family two-component response regulator
MTMIMSVSEPQVFIVDDDESVCRALARLIRSAGYAVETLDCAAALRNRIRSVTAPACVILDVNLPDLSGLELQRELNALLPIIFITGHGDISMSVDAMKAGAADFLPKPVCETVLLRSIAQALERAEQAYAANRELDAIRVRVNRLTPREREVMALVVEGRLNKQVASELGTSEQTIKIHRARVMTKMEATSLAQLIRIVDRFDLGMQSESHATH